MNQLEHDTSNGGALMLHYLATHPGARAKIVAHPDQLEPAVEELPDYEVVPAAVVRDPGLNRGMSGLGARFTPGSPEDAER